MTKKKWLIYTVLFGLLPVIARLLIMCVANTTPAFPWVQASDVISFGLVLVITNINYLEHERGVDPEWKTQQIGISLVHVVLFAILLAAACFYEIDKSIANLTHIKRAAILLTVSAGILSYVVFDRIDALQRGRGNG